MKQKKGSLTLCVLLAMGCFQIIVCLLLYAQSMSFDCIKYKEQYEQLYRRAYDIYLSAVPKIDKEKFLLLLAGSQTIVKTSFTDKENTYEGHVWIERAKPTNTEDIIVRTEILHNKKVMIALKA